MPASQASLYWQYKCVESPAVVARMLSNCLAGCFEAERIESWLSRILMVVLRRRRMLQGNNWINRNVTNSIFAGRMHGQAPNLELEVYYRMLNLHRLKLS